METYIGAYIYIKDKQTTITESYNCCANENCIDYQKKNEAVYCGSCGNQIELKDIKAESTYSVSTFVNEEEPFDYDDFAFIHIDNGSLLTPNKINDDMELNFSETFAPIEITTDFIQNAIKSFKKNYATQIEKLKKAYPDLSVQFGSIEFY
jgi:hypothetical protein